MSIEYPMLAIETTGQLASVALKGDDGRIYSDGLQEKLNHLKGLLPLTDGLLNNGGLDIRDVKTIAVSQGPGSFTGIRIGISTVRSIAQITGAKVIGVPTLETFVYNDPNYGGIVCPIFDARMDQMYAGAFMLRDRDIRILIRTDAYSSKDFLGLFTKIIHDHKKNHDMPLDFKFFGDGVDVFKQDLIHWGGAMQKDHFNGFSMGFENTYNLQVASSALKWAENFGIEMDYKELLPVYVRKAEAQRRLDEKNACK